MENQNSQSAANLNQQQTYQNPVSNEDTSPLSVGSYIVMMIVSVIPIVNLVMLFVWGFGNSNRNKKNWARAQLIMIVIGIVLCILFGASLIATLSSLGGTHY